MKLTTLTEVRTARLVLSADKTAWHWKAEDGRPIPLLDDPAGFPTFAAGLACATLAGTVGMPVPGSGIYRLAPPEALPPNTGGLTPNTAGTDPVEQAIAAAARHGEESDPGFEAGDLQGMLRAALAMMSPKAREIWAAKPEVREVVEAYPA